MNQIRIITLSALLLGCFQLCDSAAWLRSASAQDAPQDGAVAAGEKFAFTGNDSCDICHTHTKQTNARRRKRDLCLLTELPIWEDKDKHAQAYQLLNTEWGKRICDKMGYTEIPANGDQVWDRKECLSCHGPNWTGDSDQPDVAERSYKSGVTCESCHGAAEKWRNDHSGVLGTSPELEKEGKKWRELSAQVKEQTFGMINVRDPLRRARQCLSCHIGNHEQGKVVTHEMYAAGHPPLPGIEIETFIDAMPPHWRSLQEKGDFLYRKEYIAANHPGHHETDRPRAKSVLIGGVMVLRESMALFAGAAADKKPGAWPELAMFDCQACHHDLRSPSWRQQRGYGAGAPGRPTMMNWTTALVKIAIDHAAGEDTDQADADYGEFQQRLAKLHVELGRQPFGDRNRIRKVVLSGEGDTSGLAPWLGQLAARVRDSHMDKKAADRTLTRLWNLAENAPLDYHSARQVAWAIRVIAAEQGLDYPVFEGKAIANEDDEPRRQREGKNIAIFEEWKEKKRDKTRNDVGQVFEGLMINSRLALDLPRRQTVELRNPSELKLAFPSSLKNVADYDPEWFRARMKELHKKLP